MHDKIIEQTETDQMSAQTIWIGSYSSPEKEGLLRCSFSTAAGFSAGTAYNGLLNPSYLLEHPVHPVLYTVEETDEGAVCAWREENDRLIPAGRVLTGGASPCHLSLSADGNWLYCANYMGGSAACIRLDENGIPMERTDLVKHHGKGPDVQRQEMAHVHCVYPYHGQIGVCDLGEDRIYLYENLDGQLRESACLQAKPGSGPRHLAAHAGHPGCLYCVSELASDVTVWRETAPGGFDLQQELNTLPAGYSGKNTAAAIRFTDDGRWLLVSHRGADGIAAMPVRADGTLDEPAWSPCVRGPRDFLICGDTVLICSQQDGEVRAYILEAGRLKDSGFRIEVREPVCIQKALR